MTFPVTNFSNKTDPFRTLYAILDVIVIPSVDMNKRPKIKVKKLKFSTKKDQWLKIVCKIKFIKNLSSLCW